MNALERAQPYWRVRKGEPPGLTAHERDALGQQLAPESFLRAGEETYRTIVRWFLAGAALGLLLTLSLGGWVIFDLAHGNDATGAGGLLVGSFALIGCGAMALGISRSTRRGPICLHRREGVVTQKKTAGSRGHSYEYRVVVDAAVELRLEPTAGDLWRALQEGRRYRFWFIPLPAGHIVYVE